MPTAPVHAVARNHVTVYIHMYVRTYGCVCVCMYGSTFAFAALHAVRWLAMLWSNRNELNFSVHHS